MRANQTSLWGRNLCCGLLLGGILAGGVSTVQAETIDRFRSFHTIEDFNLFRDAVRLNSKFGGLNPNTEATMINDAWAAYIQAQASFAAPAIGQPQFSGAYPVSREDMGVGGLLTFGYVDPATGLPTTGPSVAFVTYAVNLDPEIPDVYLPIGMSSDASSGFSLTWAPSGFEPAIRGTPYDSAGNAVFISGVGGYNVAGGSVTNIPIPEPATLAMLALGAGTLLHRRRVGRA